MLNLCENAKSIVKYRLFIPYLKLRDNISEQNIWFLASRVCKVSYDRHKMAEDDLKRVQDSFKSVQDSRIWFQDVFR